MGGSAEAALEGLIVILGPSFCRVGPADSGTTEVLRLRLRGEVVSTGVVVVGTLRGDGAAEGILVLIFAVPLADVGTDGVFSGGAGIEIFSRLG